MLNEVLEKVKKTEDCKILSFDEIQEIDVIGNYNDVIEINTEISLQSGVMEVVLYVAMPDSSINLPKIFIKKESYENLKFLPHVNKDLSICIYEDGLNYIYIESSLPDIIEEMIHRAKGIIAQVENESYIIAEFEREFKAYWDIGYHKNDIVNEIGFSIIKDDSLPLKGYYFNPSLNGFKYLIYQEYNLFERFKSYLDFRKIEYSDIEVFEVDFRQKRPPFSMSFIVSTKCIKDSDIKRFKQTINKHGINSVLVIFKNLGKEYFGWIYNRTIPKLDSIKGWRNSLSSWQILNSAIFNNSMVERIAFSELTPERLEMRTSGYVSENQKSICIIGLGSIGSNLLNFLMKLPVNKFYLVDSDILKVENIFRHQYGFDKINWAKVDIAKLNILNKNPFCEVTTCKNSIIDVLKKEINLLNLCDLNIVVVGRTLVEKHILEHLVKTGGNRPLIIIWVEAFLAGGHMVYICPEDFSKAINLIMKFPNNVLMENEDSKIYLKEGSCQNGYYPYSEADLTMFLNSMFPYVISLFRENGNTKSKVFTWIGDKQFIKDKGIKLTEFGNSNDSFEILVKEL